MRAWLLSLLLLLPAGLYAENAVQVHTVQHQLADELLPALESVLQPGESIQAYHNELIVNASAASQQRVRDLLDELDKPLRNLLISVRNNRTGQGISQGTSVSGGIRTGDVYVGTGRPAVRESGQGLVVQHDGLRVQSQRSVQRGSQDQQQGLRVIEGYPAWISTGETRAFRNRDAYGYPVTDFQSAEQGFYVTARITGDRVLLEISTTNDRFSREPQARRQGVIQTERLETTASGAIGEWINLGSLASQQGEQQSGTSGRERSRSSSLTDISVRVTPALP